MIESHHRIVKKPKPIIKRTFPRVSITLPPEVAAHLRKRAAEPVHGGNVSSVIRMLIVGDAERGTANGHS